MKQPPFLSPGDTIGILTTGNWISRSDVAKAERIIEGWGLKTVLGETIGAHKGEFAGNDELRLRDMQKMLNNDKIKAILHAEGGHGAVRIIDRLDFSRFEEKPKWIAGYSDVTNFHSYIHANFGIQTIHSTMVSDLLLPEGYIKSSWESLRKALMGEDLTTKWRGDELNREGEAEGVLVGGNLSLISGFIGTRSEFSTNGKILFLECTREHKFRTEAFLYHLERAGRLEKLRGLIVGRYTHMKEDDPPFGMKVYEIFARLTEKYTIPVAYHYPAGHEKRHMAMIFGRKIRLTVGQDNSIIEYL